MLSVCIFVLPLMDNDGTLWALPFAWRWVSLYGKINIHTLICIYTRRRAHRALSESKYISLVTTGGVFWRVIITCLCTGSKKYSLCENQGEHVTPRFRATVPVTSLLPPWFLLVPCVWGGKWRVWYVFLPPLIFMQHP